MFALAAKGGTSTRLRTPDGSGPLIDIMEITGIADDDGRARPLGFVGSSHIALSVPDVHAECARLRAAGVTVLSDPVDFRLETGEVTTAMKEAGDGR